MVLNIKDSIKFSFGKMNENISEVALSLYASTAITSTILSFSSVFILNRLWIKKVREKRG